MENKNIKILVFRTVRITDFGFIISKIKSKFKFAKITIITKKQNYDSFKYIEKVDDVIFYNSEPIYFSNFTKKEIIELKSNHYDIIIIPHNGFIDAYDNIRDFSKQIFKNSKIMYFQLPDIFLEYKFSILQYIFKRILVLFSIILTIPVFFIYTLTLLFKSLFTSDRKQY